MPMVPVERSDSARAMALGLNPSCLAAACTRPAAPSENEPLPLITREAVPTPTPASRATSLMVAIGYCSWCGSSGGRRGAVSEGGRVGLDALFGARVEDARAREVKLHADDRA